MQPRVVLLLLWGLCVCVGGGNLGKNHNCARSITCTPWRDCPEHEHTHIGEDLQNHRRVVFPACLAFIGSRIETRSFAQLADQGLTRPHLQVCSRKLVLGLRGGATRGLMPDPSISDDAEDQGLVRVCDLSVYFAISTIKGNLRLTGMSAGCGCRRGGTSVRRRNHALRHRRRIPRRSGN